MSTSTTGTGRFIQYWAYPDQIHLSTFAIGNNRLTLGDSAALGIDRVVTSAIGSIVTAVPARGEVYSIQVRQLLVVVGILSSVFGLPQPITLSTTI